jgi:hypothetical protein
MESNRESRIRALQAKANNTNFKILSLIAMAIWAVVELSVPTFEAKVVVGVIAVVAWFVCTRLHMLERVKLFRNKCQRGTIVMQEHRGLFGRKTQRPVLVLPANDPCRYL